MTRLSNKLESLIKNNRDILPVKTEEGILVGTILIVSQGFSKSLYHKGKLLYKNLHLNITTVRIANLLAKQQSTIKTETIYRADQEYGKWFTESQLLRNQYEKSMKNKNYDKADVLWARYCESRDKMLAAKKRAEALCVISE
jgi:hypothetical protein